MKIQIEIDANRLEDFHRHIHSNDLQDTMDQVLANASQQVIEGTFGAVDDDGLCGHVEMTGFGNVGRWAFV